MEFVGIYDAISLPSSFSVAGQVYNKLGADKTVSAKRVATVLPRSGLPTDVEAKDVFAALLAGPHRDVA